MGRHSGPAAPRARRVGAGVVVAGLAVVIALVATTCTVTRSPPTPSPTAAAPSPVPAVARPPASSDEPYPRTSVYFLEQSGDDALPPVETLSRYDVVVLDSEWARLDPDYFRRLRAAAPGIKILAYVILVDMPKQVGTRNRYGYRYDLWRFDTSTTNRFPPQWLARTAAGAPVSEWPGTVMTNLTDVAPAADGTTFAQHAADWITNTVWSTGLWDGVYLDAWGDRIFTADKNSWDINGDGVDEPDSAIYGPGSPWERGVDRIEAEIRRRLPGAFLVANGDRTLRAQQLDGLVLESFGDKQVANRDPAYDLRRYVDASNSPGRRQPGLFLTINRRPAGGPLTPDDLRRARYFLTGTLLQDGYWAPMGTDYGQPEYYDELDGGGLGRGYLGRALAANPTWSMITAPFRDGIGQVRPGVTRRDFERGIALRNDTNAPVAVPLERPYRKLSGRQDPAVNDGQVVSEVTLGARDGLILLRSG